MRAEAAFMPTISFEALLNQRPRRKMRSVRSMYLVASDPKDSFVSACICSLSPETTTAQHLEAEQ